MPRNLLPDDLRDFHAPEPVAFRLICGYLCALAALGLVWLFACAALSW